MKPEHIKSFFDTTKIFAGLSKARRLKVGAIVVKDDRIISIGYNGTPAGWDNNCEDKIYSKLPSDTAYIDPITYEHITDDMITDRFPFKDENCRYKLVTKPEVIHAEMNAIGKLAKSNESGDGATMIITHAPCVECAKLIAVSGISKVYFGEAYRSTDGVDFLKKCGVEVEIMQEV